MSTAIDYIDYIAQTYQFVMSTFSLIIGMISNLAIIGIFTAMRAFKGNQCAFYLTVESVADIGILLMFFPSHIISHLTGRSLTLTSVAWCKTQLMCGYGFGLCSLYTICFMAFDQYLSTNHRYSWRQKSSIQLAQRLISIIIVLSLIHGVLFFIFGRVDIFGCTIYHPIVRLYFSYFYYPILSGILPVVISITFSLLAYRNVRRIVRRQLAVVRRRLDRQMTALALSRVLCIVMFGLPFIAVSLYDLNVTRNDNDLTQLAILRLVSTVTYSLLYINYCINFYVFLIVSSRYRHQVKQFLVKRFRHSCKNLPNVRPAGPNSNRVAPEHTRPAASVLESV